MFVVNCMVDVVFMKDLLGTGAHGLRYPWYGMGQFWDMPHTFEILVVYVIDIFLVGFRVNYGPVIELEQLLARFEICIAIDRVDLNLLLIFF